MVVMHCKMKLCNEGLKQAIVLLTGYWYLKEGLQYVYVFK